MIKSLIVAAAVAFTSTAVIADDAKQPETKRVCVMQKDAKTGKEKEVCKQVKVHKKLDGTKVPEKK